MIFNMENRFVAADCDARAAVPKCTVEKIRGVPVSIDNRCQFNLAEALKQEHSIKQMLCSCLIN